MTATLEFNELTHKVEYIFKRILNRTSFGYETWPTNSIPSRNLPAQS